MSENICPTNRFSEDLRQRHDEAAERLAHGLLVARLVRSDLLTVDVERHVTNVDELTEETRQPIYCTTVYNTFNSVLGLCSLSSPELDLELLHFFGVEAEGIDEEGFGVGEWPSVHLRTDCALQFELQSLEVGTRHVRHFVQLTRLLLDLVDRELDGTHLSEKVDNDSVEFEYNAMKIDNHLN